MRAYVDTLETTDEGIVTASRMSDEWLLFTSDYDNKSYWVSPEVVTFE